MLFHDRFVIIENIERFEALLCRGGLDRQQTLTVQNLLAQARDHLVVCDAMVTAPLPGFAAVAPPPPWLDSSLSAPDTNPPDELLTGHG